MWLEIARENTEVELWAYTKSLRYWVNRIDQIPANLVLTASYGGRNDELIDQYNLKHVKVVKDIEETNGGNVDYNDDIARIPNVNFYLIDNYKK